MSNEKRDWETPISGLCDSCLRGDHTCTEDTIGYVCDCEQCADDRAAVETSSVEFFNGLEDFFKSIDPERVGWDVEESVFETGEEVARG